jgi:Domain of unknown function (DUF4333)
MRNTPSTIRLVMSAIIGATLLLAACGGPSEDSDRVEAAFRDDLEIHSFDTNPEDLKSVSCPDDLELEPELSFECTVEATDPDDSGPCDMVAGQNEIDYSCPDVGFAEGSFRLD